MTHLSSFAAPPTQPLARQNAIVWREIPKSVICYPLQETGGNWKQFEWFDPSVTHYVTHPEESAQQPKAGTQDKVYHPLGQLAIVLRRLSHSRSELSHLVDEVTKELATVKSLSDLSKDVPKKMALVDLV
jgi:hypothetical protein